MLVGEVRCATTAAGCSWKLSGGSQWSSAPTKVSKNAQVLREMARRKRVCSGVRCAGLGASGRLTHQAIAGEASQRSRIGAARASAVALEAASQSAAATARTGPIHIDL